MTLMPARLPRCMKQCVPQGATVLQMFPFGWTAPDGKMHREELYSNMVEAANCTYHRWANKRWYLAHLRR